MDWNPAGKDPPCATRLLPLNVTPLDHSKGLANSAMTFRVPSRLNTWVPGISLDHFELYTDLNE
jgi:hypothetical protein